MTPSPTSRRTPVRTALAVATAALIAAAAAAPPASAQANDPPPPDSPVPLALVEAFLPMFQSGEAPRVIVGELPEPLATVVQPPAGSRTVGSIVSSRFTAGAVSMALDPDDAGRAWTEALVSAGLRPPPERRWREGFQPSPTPSSPRSFCGPDGELLNLGTRPNPRGGTYVTLTLSGVSSRNACDDLLRRVERREEAFPLPSLVAPSGSRSMGGGISGGRGYRQAHARLDTDRGLEEILDHYDAQLRETGWTADEGWAADGVGVRSYSVPAEDGEARRGMLTALRVEPGAYSVTLDVVGPER